MNVERRKHSKKTGEALAYFLPSNYCPLDRKGAPELSTKLGKSPTPANGQINRLSLQDDGVFCKFFKYICPLDSQIFPLLMMPGILKYAESYFIRLINLSTVTSPLNLSATYNRVSRRRFAQ